MSALRAALPNINIQMLLAGGRNTVGYTPYPTEVTDAFVREAAASGVDIFRIFDALNDVSQMRPAIESVLETGTTIAEVALCYTADLLDPAEKLYTLDYYLRLAEQIVSTPARTSSRSKTWRGLLRAEAAEKLVTALRERFDLPVHVHTRTTPLAASWPRLLAASRAGADAVDVASAPMAGTTSQPSASALVAALVHTQRDTGLSLQAVSDLEPYWEAVRHAYKPFESGLPGADGGSRLQARDSRAASCPTFASRPLLWGWATTSSASKTSTAAASTMLGRPAQGDPLIQGRRRPRARARRGERRP